MNEAHIIYEQLEKHSRLCLFFALLWELFNVTFQKTENLHLPHCVANVDLPFHCD